jgi:hypothetical protein
MIVKTIELLDLFVKANKLGFSFDVYLDEDGNYVIKFYEQFTQNYNEKVIITPNSESDWNNSGTPFNCMVDEFDALLKAKEEKRIREVKRKELISTLTPEQRDLLGL